jgi:hypothetical protein
MIKKGIMPMSQIGRLEGLNAEMETDSAREMIRYNITISAKESPGFYELKKHKACFNEGCLKLLAQRKQSKQQWLQNPSEINGNNLNNAGKSSGCTTGGLYSTVLP